MNKMVKTFVCLIDTTKKGLIYTKCDTKMALNMYVIIGTYVGEDQLHSGLLVDKRPKTI